MNAGYRAWWPAFLLYSNAMLRSMLCSLVLATAAYSAVVVPLPLNAACLYRLERGSGSYNSNSNHWNSNHRFHSGSGARVHSFSGSSRSGHHRRPLNIPQYCRVASTGRTGFYRCRLLPPSVDPAFTNVVPSFVLGTTDLILFDLVIPGGGVRFDFTMIDSDGDIASPIMFSTPSSRAVYGTASQGV